ncbi:hypothetical protein M407DRAFT_190350 [Tulasnella calospora MUT 4182]|uniref:Uncharacterized protein n=1 Tax=Tulasnella calospora MUT 4182 TaxID=1051891 RepID=A0A0C3M1H1_9AGAM|nr:hypothetical protein M407DRAFT_190350 [Tulasnella calospora MUT 4182]
MILDAFLGLIFKPADLSTRISDAEKRIQALLGVADDGCSRKDDVECVKIVHDLIAPQLEWRVRLIRSTSTTLGLRLTSENFSNRLRFSFTRSSEAELHTWRIIRDQDWELARLQQNRMYHIELMIYLIETRDLHSNKFWMRVARWQVAKHQSECTRILANFIQKRLEKEPRDGQRCQHLISNLQTAVGRALSETDPSPNTAKFTDVFVIRELHDDPDMKRLIASDFFTRQERQILLGKTEKKRFDKPYFPPECYDMLSDDPFHLSVDYSPLVGAFMGHRGIACIIFVASLSFVLARK